MIVILSPHFDDAVLSCWSVLSGSRPVEVLNVFTRGDRGSERAAEDRAALGLVGARSRNLELPEYPDWMAGAKAARWRQVARRLRDVMEASAPHIPGEAHVYAPAALGANPDHELVRELGCRLLRDGARVSFYADQPYCYAYGWPHWVIGEAPDPHLDLERYWRLQLETASVSFADLDVDVVRLDRAHDAKVRALRLYQSQFAALEAGANRRVTNPELTGLEVFWHA